MTGRPKSVALRDSGRIPAAAKDLLASLGSSIHRIWSGSGTLGAVAQTVLVKALILGMNVATGVICARSLGPEGRGLLATLIMWPNLVAALATCGIPHSQLYHMRVRPAECASVFSAAMLLIVPAGCLAGLMAAALMPFMLSEHLAEDILFAQAIMLVTPAVSLSLVLQTGAEATQDFFGANAMRAGTVLTVFFSLSVLLLTDSVTPYLAALSYSLAFLPVTVWLSVRLWRNIRPTLRGIKRSLGNTLRYALRCYTLDLIGTAAFYASQVAVVMLLAPAMVGYFFVALGVARIMEVTYTAVSTVLLPKTAGLERAEVVEKTIRAARLNLLGSAPVTLLLCLSAGTLIPLIYGKDFGSAVLLARILLAEVLLTGTTFILTQAFLALGRPRVPTLLNIVSLAATISGMVIAVPFMGATGVALVMLAVSCLKLTTVVACHVWLLEVPLRAFWFKSRDIDFVCGLFGRIRNSSAA